MAIRPKKSLLNPNLFRPSALKSVPRSREPIWLDKNENLDSILMNLNHSILLELPLDAIATYPEAGETYRKLSDYVGVEPESLILTPGSDGAIRYAFEAFVDPGDYVMHTSPTFAMYSVYCQMFGANAITIEYTRKEEKPYLDLNQIKDNLKKYKPKLLCLPNPDSPTGTIIAAGELSEILNLCEQTGTVLLLDEAYFPFYDWTGVPWTKRSSNLVVARTFAKAWGLAGLRVGYAVAAPNTIDLFHKIRPMYEVNTLAVEFLSRALDREVNMKESVVRIKDGKKFFEDKMRSFGFGVLQTEGNFTHVDFGRFGKSVHSTLFNKVYYRQAFEQPCLKGYSRFSVAPISVMKEVVELIEETVKAE
ncbi:pyridoxal phosphate-dependent aminotransferase [Leptospira stimsonii]|uniref:Histidinol-phosphate/aromatic aminotransferase and cobyric acid decarboxylase n=1 Tax=Leptospira stimsonii TaxID=2202203 RepID=A0A396Z873_9LEPT|nr:histidinol-phosphate transaminase [Leptospira stimsonii]RHX90865.1 histidinol-phosphate/aromatic aminotransferase and cobyric acid decarboxylase [Leptospira stimsonii]